MSFPSNPLEHELQRAAQGTIPTLDFIRNLVDATIFVALSDAKDGDGVGLSTVIIDGVVHLPVYTSEEQLRRAGGSKEVMAPPLRELLDRIPPGTGLAVNMGGDVGLPIAAEAIRAVTHDLVSLEPGTRLRIGEPAVEPQDLLTEFVKEFAELPAVRAAGRCWAQVGDCDPSLVISVDLDPDNPEMREIAVNGVRRAATGADEGFMVDLVFAADRSVFTEWIEENSGQFYA